MNILICFALPIPGRGCIDGHAIHEVTALTQSEIERICREQRMLIQKSLARGALSKGEDPPNSGDLILKSVTKLDDESPLILPVTSERTERTVKNHAVQQLGGQSK